MALGIEGPAGWEFATMVEPDLVRRDRTYSANSGLVLGLTDDLMLDGGVRWGLTDSAPDVAAFVGGSGRY